MEKGGVSGWRCDGFSVDHARCHNFCMISECSPLDKALHTPRYRCGRGSVVEITEKGHVSAKSQLTEVSAGDPGRWQTINCQHSWGEELDFCTQSWPLARPLVSTE